MEKNIASQTFKVFAFDANGDPVTGDAAQITGSVKIDSAAAAAIGSGANPTEIGNGYYEFAATQAETNGKEILVIPVSSTSGVNVVGVPALIKTDTPNMSSLGVESDGDLTKVNTCEVNTDQRGTDGANTTEPDNASITSIESKVDLLAVDLTFVRGMSGGNWEIDTTANQMIFYNEAGTEIKRFDLTKDGVANSVSPDKRTIA